MVDNKKRGFSMVEMIIVMLILGIIAAAVLLNASTTTVIKDTTEADKIVRMLQSLRTGWLAYYADNREFLGLKGKVAAIQTFDADAPFTKSLEIYLDRDLKEDIDSYGNILLVSNSRDERGAKISLGITFHEGKQPTSSVFKLLVRDAAEYNLSSSSGATLNNSSDKKSILLKVY